MSERQVRRIINEKLIPSGEVVARPDAGDYGTTVYALPGVKLDGPVPLPDKMSADLPDKMSARKPRNVRSATGHIRKSTGHIGTILPDIAVSAEPIRNPLTQGSTSQESVGNHLAGAAAREGFSPASPNLSPADLLHEALAIGTTPPRLAGELIPQWADRRLADGRPRADWRSDLRAWCREYLKREGAAGARASPGGNRAPYLNTAEKSVAAIHRFAERHGIHGEASDPTESGVPDGALVVDGSLSPGVQRHGRGD